MTTFDQQLRAYQAQGDNLLLPSHHQQQASALHKPVLEVVPLHPDSGDVYFTMITIWLWGSVPFRYLVLLDLVQT
jgi:hypothetical protein